MFLIKFFFTSFSVLSFSFDRVDFCIVVKRDTTKTDIVTQKIKRIQRSLYVNKNNNNVKETIKEKDNRNRYGRQPCLRNKCGRSVRDHNKKKLALVWRTLHQKIAYRSNYGGTKNIG